ncbi:GRB10-interacting GYF protein 2 isoform X3 [Spea bombifrons]|uniref:GRB10-interacting GYF protein 2 isoform X3 n=1 Tax=Spea bombifrons TaxID=233779 RepID=UPI00234BA719|nr:GRB10-interacting GYF protein 2 isoform X3 [Spea bombifrons]
MTAETQTLNFGPEWLRALSSGGSVVSPPLSPALQKYKLADYRYGREEMLALYIKDNKIPSDLMDKEFLPILKEEPLLPLALVPFTEEEQRNFSMSVNSSAVLRLTGRGSGGGGGTVVGAPRGRSSSRGRGRGRGEGGFYQRSFDEVESGFGRGAREMHRSQSWEERGDRRFEKPARKEQVRPAFEDASVAPTVRKHEFVRSESVRWRSLREELNGEEEEGGGVWRTAAPRREGERWRSNSPDGARGSAWREHPDRRKRFDYDFRERDDERGFRRPHSGSGSAEDERDALPEWCLEDAEDETGTFDSSGAFLSSKKVQKESIPEEQELDFRPATEGHEHSDSDSSHTEEVKETNQTQSGEHAKEAGRNVVQAASEREHRTPSPAKWTEPCSQPPLKNASSPLSNHNEQEVKPLTSPAPPTPPNHKEEGHRGSIEKNAPCIPHSTSAIFSQSTAVRQVHDPHSSPPIHPAPVIPLDTTTATIPPSVSGAPGMGSVPHEPDEEDGLEHLEQQAQQLVAYLQDGTLDDDRLSGKVPDHRIKGPSPDNQQKWYYKDPQGEIQGPFSNREMAEWFQAGYFPMTLLLRRACDEAFQPLGEIIKLWGRIPFVPPQTPRLGEMVLEHLGHQDMRALYQLQHLHYRQFLIQQQYAQVLAQQQKAALSSQQQQQLALLSQQFQSLKMRHMSVPDNTSLWELQSAASPPTVWEGSSVWDLPVEPVSQGAAREQLEQLEKVKAAKVSYLDSCGKMLGVTMEDTSILKSRLEQERREAELRAKQEEEEHRRRLEEEKRKRQEEEELARRKQEEALRRQREQELIIRRQMEEEERQREEERRQLEERRRLEEERRRQDEEKRRQEEERRRREEERKQLEEEKRRREEEKKKEEERRQREEMQRKQEEAARWAREEEEAARRLLEETQLKQEEEERKKREEAQRQKELQRQRQQQQEALRRLQQQQQQQQLAQMKLPSSSTWGQQVIPGNSAQSALSLAEIQKLEEERERQQREERRQQQEMKAIQQQQQQQMQQQKSPGWANMSKSAGGTKSLLEIQQEEARQMQKIQQQAGRGRPANISVPPATVVSPPQHNSSSSSNSSGGSVWGTLNNNISAQWSPDSINSIWSSTDNKSSGVGFWDDAVKEVAPKKPARKNNASKSAGTSSRQNKKVEQEEKLLRLFQGAPKTQDSFTQWCEQTLHALNTAHSLDVPTFVSFLREVESSYEVHDYVRAYLGDTAEAKDFSKQFLERRTKQKTGQQRQQQDSAWGTFQTSQNNVQQTSMETAQSAGRKKKKQKMVRADPSLLGFSVNASSERLNMGEIETLEDY